MTTIILGIVDDDSVRVFTVSQRSERCCGEHSRPRMARDTVAFHEGYCGEHSTSRVARYVGCIGKTIIFGIVNDNPWY